MKKTTATIVLAMVMFLATPVYAEYKDTIRNDVMKELGAFFQRNDGGKVSVDLIDGLAMHLDRIFEANRVFQKGPEIDKSVPPMEKEVKE